MLINIVPPFPEAGGGGAGFLVVCVGLGSVFILNQLQSSDSRGSK